jgi:23S rRNA (uridine2552-2'-O)-methyltransferase
MSSQYKRKDYLYQQAKSDGYRSRAAFKLIELDKRFKLLGASHRILDLGAWPGSWLQVVRERARKDSVIVGIDLVKIDPIPTSHIHLIQGDIGEASVIEEALVYAGGLFSTVLSDASPKLTGIREVDQARISQCGEMVLNACHQALVPGGSMVMKLFKGSEVDNVIKEARKLFTKVTRVELDATRNSSNEFYIVCSSHKSPS